ncbi:hypothetical protein KEJ49_05120 [Candidatus Bathyarchaeota archaeon]|nr:hypothetical protein [Candidatus Bathyarchaeota archaeon]
MKERKFIAILALTLLILQFSPVVSAAPSGEIYFPEVGVSSAHNVLETGRNTTVTISFKNTAGASITDVASTIQYITIAAANLNPTRTSINHTAQWEIYVGTTSRASGTVVAGTSNEKYSPYSTTTSIELYTWQLGPPNETLVNYTDPNQFNDNLRILRPGEVLNFTVTINCQGEVGDSVIWFFFKASEDDFEGQNYPTSINQINDKCNLYYSKLPGPNETRYWLPLHNSYDPYDQVLGTGHSFMQHSWIREPTTHAFAKGNKHVHQKQVEIPPQTVYTFHICGVKFLDVNGNGVWEMGIDQPVNGVILWLLAKTGDGRFVPADGVNSPYHGKISVIEEHGNPVLSGEGGETLPGHYCFNLNVTETGTYEFYIWLDESSIMENYRVYPSVENKSLIINATLIGPITLTTGENEVSYNNNFANYQPPVGGIIIKAMESNPPAPGPHPAFIIASIGLAGAAFAYAITQKFRSKPPRF